SRREAKCCPGTSMATTVPPPTVMRWGLGKVYEAGAPRSGRVCGMLCGSFCSVRLGCAHLDHGTADGDRCGHAVEDAWDWEAATGAGSGSKRTTSELASTSRLSAAACTSSAVMSAHRRGQVWASSGSPNSWVQLLRASASPAGLEMDCR